MKRFLVFGAVMASLLFLIGCSEDSNGESVSVITELDGAWDADGDIINISDGIMTMQELDLDSTLEVSFSITGQGEKTLQVNNTQVQKVYVEMTQFLFTPHLTSKVITLNSEQECGYTNWEVNVTKDVTSCYKKDFQPYKHIFSLENDTLIWGDENQVASDGYPDALDFTDVWTRYSGQIEEVRPSLPDEFYSLDDLNGSWQLVGDDFLGTYPITISHTQPSTINELRMAGFSSDVYIEDIVSATVIGGKTMGEDNHLVKIIEQTFLNRTITVRSQDDIDLVNSNALCGYTDWEINETKSVGYCEKQEPYTDYTIYFIENNILYFGDKSVLGSDGYPDALDNSRTWHRQ